MICLFIYFVWLNDQLLIDRAMDVLNNEIIDVDKEFNDENIIDNKTVCIYPENQNNSVTVYIDHIKTLEVICISHYLEPFLFNQ